MNYLAALLYVVYRLKEPSSYAGMVGFYTILRVGNPDTAASMTVQILAIAASVAAIVIPEKK